MKGLLALALIISPAFYSCKKSNADSTKPPATTWTLKGISYTGDSSYSSTGDAGTRYPGKGDVGSLDSGEVDQIDLFFANTHPASGTYAVIIADGLTPLSSTDVSIVVTTVHGNAQRPGGSYFYSTGATDDTVNISVSGNTLTASFANISLMENDQPIVKLSGTIVAKAQ